MTNILTIFAGRRANIEILKRYLDYALNLGIIDEVHVWNYARNEKDSEYLKTISNLRRSSSITNTFIEIFPRVLNNSFELKVKVFSDIHIKLSDGNITYEILLGGWNNTKSLLLENDREILTLIENNITSSNDYIKYHFGIIDDILYVKKSNKLLMVKKIHENFKMQNIYFKTGFHVGHLKYEVSKNNKWHLMEICHKSWKDYYLYYNSPEFKDDVIIKCDDDILFIDIDKLPNYINFIKENTADLTFANIINNSVCAYYQQMKYKLLPMDLIELELPKLGFGELWNDGKKAEILHDYFIDNYEKFISADINDIIQIDFRFSINFMGFKGSNSYKFISDNDDDEYHLTVTNTENKLSVNVMYGGLIVSHLSYYRQVETGINTERLIQRYTELCNRVLNE